MRVIVVNPEAKRLRQNRRIRQLVRDRFSKYAHIIDISGADKVIGALDALSQKHTVDFVYVVGGDGTFNNVLNWIAALQPELRPALISVGGGQFCYMTKFHGLPSKDPIKNLAGIFSNKIKLDWKNWQPVCVHDSVTNTKRYAAVVAGGVISDILQWYENVGKGGFFRVLQIIIMAALSVASDTIRKLHGRLKIVDGEMILGTAICTKKSFVGFAFSTIPKLLASCQPFGGIPNMGEYYSAAYWGGWRSLALASPFVWFGLVPFWIKRKSYNQPIRTAIIRMSDTRLVLDGDVYVWPESTKQGPEKQNSEKRTLTFTIGETIALMVVEKQNSN